MKEKWFGARITGPEPGTFSGEMARARRNVYAYSEVISRVNS